VSVIKTYSETPEVLQGWGGTSPSRATVWRPHDPDEVDHRIRAAGAHDDMPRGVVARGLGRSYGDAAQNAGGHVLAATAFDRVLELDVEAGTVRCEAGASLDMLLHLLVPLGWFPTVVPGTRQVTVGGAIAADVHGKFRHGSFCDYVDRATLVTPADGPIEISAHEHADAFWATAGGMGLTGTVTEATMRLHPIETSAMVVDTQRCRDVDECMAAMIDGDDAYRYSVAWIDCLAQGRSLGRSILERGNHARIDELPRSRASDPLAYTSSFRPVVPFTPPSGLLNGTTIKALNALWFRKSPSHPHHGVRSIPGFFHPLDDIVGWNRVYGTRGFVQYQPVVPYGHEAVIRRMLEQLAAHGLGSFVSVLKRFETGNDGYLSFPMPGWTLALDIPVGDPELAQLLDRFDEWVLEAGGRVYLAKDARVSSAAFAAMYPRLSEWRDVRDRLDPDGLLCSDLARRLQLVKGG
jgi:decaprenylphospho-beta-D-ribofuranose 2-oxidase